MKNFWLLFILLTSVFLLACLKAQEVSSLHPMFTSEPVLKINAFAESKKNLNPEESELLELWESMMTGRSAPLSKWIKAHYKALGMNHVFTPSGFHLSAVLMPFMSWVRVKWGKCLIYTLMGVLLSFLPGLGALKRMLIIKLFQNASGLKLGFVLAIVADMLWGSFQESPLSMTYSFLFLGIIYSGIRGLDLCFWFFIAQGILAFFQCQLLSPWLILISPLLNLLFGLVMPALFLLSFPLAEWQLRAGLFLLKIVQFAVEMAFHLVSTFPLIEVDSWLMIIFILFLLKRWWAVGLATLFLCGSLNLDLDKNPVNAQYQFVPMGDVVKIVSGEKEDRIYFRDGRCKRKLVRGIWYERCSPIKRSTSKKIMKLSYL